MKALLIKLHSLIKQSRHGEFLGPLLLRLYLVPVFWMAGTSKLDGFDNTVQWFGNAEWGLGLPFPMLMVVLVIGAEILGAVSLLLGIAVRWFSIPLMVTMAVAALSVHWDNGWQAISDPGAPFANERVMAASEKLDIVKDVLKQNTKYDYITSTGKVVMLNNGIEFSVTYFIMLLTLLFTGAGRYVSIDYWFTKKLYQQKTE